MTKSYERSKACARTVLLTLIIFQLKVSFVFLYEFRLICKFNFALHFFSLPLLLKSFIAVAPMYPRYGYRLCGL